MQYRAMRYVSFKKELCCRKKKDRRIGSGEVRAKEKELTHREIEDAQEEDDWDGECWSEEEFKEFMSDYLLSVWDEMEATY
jgi:hypothetical protein